MQAGCTVLKDLLWCCSAPSRPGEESTVTPELGFGRESHTRLKNNPEVLTVFFGTGKQKSGSLEKWAAGNGNIPFNFAFLTLLNYKELESRHNYSFLRHNTLKCRCFGVLRGDQRKEGGKKWQICIFHMLLLVEAFVIKLYIQKFTG